MLNVRSPTSGLSFSRFEESIGNSIINDSINNITQYTSRSSNDENIPAFRDDPVPGVLHLLGEKVQQLLEKYMKEGIKDGYAVRVHDVSSDSFSVRSLVHANTSPLNGPLHYYVLHEFENNELFPQLKALSVRIIGYPVVVQCLQTDIALSHYFGKKDHYQTFTLHMSRCLLCFTNFSSKTELNELRQMVRHMNGKIIADYPPEENGIILIAASAGRAKYETHQALERVPLKRKWVDDLYALRHEVNVRPGLLLLEDLELYVCPLFYNINAACIGMSADDKTQITSRGGTIVDIHNRHCSHIIVQSNQPAGVVTELLGNKAHPNPNVEIITETWMWECLVSGSYLRPKDYRFPSSKHEQTRKRRPMEASCLTPSSKRRVSSELERSVIANTSVCTIEERGGGVVGTPPQATTPTIVASPSPIPAASKRNLIIKEFISTEKSYVTHLGFIEKNYFGELIAIYKKEIEAAEAQLNSLIKIQNENSKKPFKHQDEHGSIGRREGEQGKKLEEATKRVDQARESLEKVHKIFYRVLPIKLAHEKLLHKLESDVISDMERGECKDHIKMGMSFGEILLGWTGKSYDSKRSSVRRLTKDEIQGVFGYGLMPRSEVWKSFVRQLRNEEYVKHHRQKSKESSTTASKTDGVASDDNNTQDITKSRDTEGNTDVYEGTFVPDVLKSYSKYLTGWESIKSNIDMMKNYPPNAKDQKFSSHLRAQASKIELERLDLDDLMIEPVQRLPRFIILIDAIISKTPEKHSEHILLQKVKEEFQQSTTVLNDRKRDMDEKRALGELLNSISGFPRERMSSNLRVSMEALVQTDQNISSTFTQGQWLQLFVFSYDHNVDPKENIRDSEIVIVKSKDKSKSGTNLYKHILSIPLYTISYVIDVTESDFDDKIALSYKENFIPSNFKFTDNRKHKDKRKSEGFKEITLKFRLESPDLKTDLLQLLRRETERSYERFNLGKPDDIVSLMSESTLDDVILLREEKDSVKSKGFINFAKRSVSRAFSQKSSRYPLRKTQSTLSFSPGPPERFPKRTMRDSH